MGIFVVNFLLNDFKNCTYISKDRPQEEIIWKLIVILLFCFFVIDVSKKSLLVDISEYMCVYLYVCIAVCMYNCMCITVYV